MRASLLISALLVSPGLLWAEVHLVRALAWQVFDAEGKPPAERGRLDDAISVWGSAAATALPDGSFTVIY